MSLNQAYISRTLNESMNKNKADFELRQIDEENDESGDLLENPREESTTTFQQLIGLKTTSTVNDTVMAKNIKMRLDSSSPPRKTSQTHPNYMNPMSFMYQPQSQHQQQHQNQYQPPDPEIHMDFSNLNNLFNAYATKKTYATGLLDLALMATNFTQLKQLIIEKGLDDHQWQPIDIVLIFFISLSIIMQLICGMAMLFTAKHEFINESDIRYVVIRNNWITMLVLAITVINLFINVFMNI